MNELDRRGEIPSVLTEEAGGEFVPGGLLVPSWSRTNLYSEGNHPRTAG